MEKQKKDEDSLNYDLRNLLSLPDELGDVFC